MDSAKPTTSSPVASTAQASYSNEGRPSAISAVNGLDSSLPTPETPATPDSTRRTASFPSPARDSDPTTQQFAHPRHRCDHRPEDGTDDAPDRTPRGTATDLRRLALRRPPSPIGAVTGRDAYGNSTAVTQQLQGELAKVRAENAKAQADYDARFGNRPTYEQQQQAEADRFNRFVRQSTADSPGARSCHRRRHGRSNAGKIAALDAIQRGLNSKTTPMLRRTLQAMRARSGIAETRMLGDNRLAETAPAGPEQSGRGKRPPGSPSTALLARKTQGEIADADAVRAVRNEIADSAASGNQTAYNNAVKKGIAFRNSQE